MEDKQKQTHPEVGEDATQYGEFVSSYFAWISLPKQKEKAEELSKMTKENRHQMPKWQKRTGTKCQNGKKEPAPNDKMKRRL